MRQMIIQVERGQGERVVAAARKHDAERPFVSEAVGEDGPIDVVECQVENDRVEALVADLRELPGLSVTLLPQEAITLTKGEEGAEKQVARSRPRSPLEIYIYGLRSEGSWPSFSGYAVVAGAVAWTGLLTNTVFLLIAAMLVAPYPSPAMNSALATARGDLRLLGRSIFRYVAVIAIGVATAGLLTLVFEQELVTDLMRSISFISPVAFILPLAAGVAGGLYLGESEHSTLLSAASAGVLVALALAPPTAVLGMATAMGEWEMAKRVAFLLILQIAGINLSGALVLHFYGLRSSGIWYERGKAWVRRLAYAVSAVAFAGLLVWQFSSAPEFLRTGQSRLAVEIAQKAVQTSGLAGVLSAGAGFTGAEVNGQPALVISLEVYPKDRAAGDLAELLRRRVQQALESSEVSAVPFVRISVLEAPSHER